MSSSRSSRTWSAAILFAAVIVPGMVRSAKANNVAIFTALSGNGAFAGHAVQIKGRNPASGKTAIFGINIGDGAIASGLQPGKFGYNWMMPSHRDVETAYAAGVRMFRLPLLAERMQDGFNGPLRAEAVTKVYPVIDYILSKPGAIALIDWHDFGKRNGVPYGAGAWSNAAIVGLNAKFLAPYKRSRVWVDLQNEPGNPVDYWHTQQAVITGLRSQGYANPIVVEGTGYATAYDWEVGSPKDLGFRSLKDPLARLYASVHVYPDSNDSGTHADCVAGSESRLDPAIESATKGGYRLIVGEIGFSADPSCNAVRSAYVAKLKGSPVVAAVTFWGFFSSLTYPRYIYGLRNSDGTPSPLLNRLVADWQR